MSTLKSKDKKKTLSNNQNLTTSSTEEYIQSTNSAQSMIEYFKIRSKKVETSHQKFNINNILNDILGSIVADFKGSNSELIFDVDHNVQKILLGDSVHVRQVLSNILHSSMENTPSGEVRLEISQDSLSSHKNNIQFKITNQKSKEPRDDTEIDINTIFEPKYDEQKKRYTGLDLYVAKELVSILHGELSVKEDSKNNITFLLTLPFGVIDGKNRRQYRLSKKELTEKKVLIVDDNYHSALAIEKMFAYFKHEVEVIQSEEFKKKKPKLQMYDIVILDEKLINNYIIIHITRIKEEEDLKFVILSSIFKTSNIHVPSGIVDKYIKKPFTQERIFELIMDLYVPVELVSEKKTVEHKESNISSEQTSLRKDSFVEASNISTKSFIEFKDANLLIVEDNILTQKVMTNILGKSKINLTIANNGQEAIDILNQSPTKFDLVLMDISMPVMDGYAATALIRDDARFNHLPIVALSALILDSEIKKMFRSGVNGYIQKPISLGMMYSAFEIFLGKYRKQNINITQSKIDDTAKDIYGINIKQGITNVGGNIGLYRELLREFLNAYENSNESMSELVATKNYKKLIEFSLDMKGLTATIGAYKIHNLVSRIHKILISDYHVNIPALAEIYKVEFNKLKVSLRGYILE